MARILLLHGVALSTPGVPLLYLGDEVGTLNDHAYLQDPAKAGDSRWVHRPPRDAARHAARHNPDTDAGRVFQGLRRLINARRNTPALGGPEITPFGTGNPHVLGYLRGQYPHHLLVLANFSDEAQTLPASIFSAANPQTHDPLSGDPLDIGHDLTLPAYGQLWLNFDCS